MMCIQFEYTAPGAPQQNGLIEKKFATLFKSIHIIFIGKKFSFFLKNEL